MVGIAALRLRGLRLPVKLGLVAAVLGTVIAWGMATVHRAQSEVIDYSVREQDGVRLHRAMRIALRDLQTQRGAASNGPAKNPEQSAAQEKARAAVDAAVSGVDATLRDVTEVKAVTDAWTAIRGGWTTLKGELASLDGSEAVRRHTVLVEATLEAMDLASREYGVVLDPEAASYYLVNGAIILEPAATASLGSLRSAGLLVLRGEASPQQRDRFTASFHSATIAMKQIDTALAESVRADSAVKAQLGDAAVTARKAAEALLAEVKKIVEMGETAPVDPAAYSKLGSAATAARYALYDTATKTLSALIDARIATRRAKRLTDTALLGTATVLGFLLAAVMLFDLVGRLRAAGRFADDVANGRLDREVERSGRDEVATLLGGLASMRDAIAAQRKRDREQLEETLKIRNALDVCATGVMIADADGRLAYANAEMGRLLRLAERDLQHSVPQFSAAKPMGTNIDALHAGPDAKRLAIVGTKEVLRTQLDVGDRVFAVAASPIVDPEGGRLGTVVEWQDRTAEVSAEGELGRVIAAAAAGDFTPRVTVEGKTGYYRQFSEATNGLLESVAGGLAELRAVLDGLAHGDLGRRMRDNHQGVFAELQTSTNATFERLAQLVAEIETASRAIDTASREIAQGNADLSGRTEQQASALEETASSMEELTSTVKQNADNARQAHALAATATDVARAGGATVSEAVTTMSAIEESSKRIGDILGVIDGIAFQTNILALNAAVEAARAGEQGRGFAVVAAEVRTLAQRSAAAAREIKSLIADSTSRVGAGVTQVNAAGSRMTEIVSAIQRVADILGEISTASVEQSDGIEQVSRAVSSMDEMTQQNAALVEEAAAASESLQDQAQALVGTIGFFRGERSGQSAARGAEGIGARRRAA